MGVRFDPKVVLSMFNESKINAEQMAEKDRINAVNAALEKQKMADENSYRMNEVALQNRAADESVKRGDQMAAWHEADTKERMDAAQLANKRYEDQMKLTATQRTEDLNFRKKQEEDQNAISWAQIGGSTDPVTGKRISPVQTRINAENAHNIIAGSFKNEVADIFKGVNMNDDPSKWTGNNQQNIQKVNAFIEAGTKFNETVRKYRSGGFDPDVEDPLVMKQYGDLYNRYTGGQTGIGALQQVNAPLIGPGMFGKNPATALTLGAIDMVHNYMTGDQAVPQSSRVDAYNRMQQLGSLINQSGANIPGAVYDPKSKRFIPGQ
jgi:hypothetical protein